MKLVFLTALGVGGATVIGSLIGLCFRRISQKFTDMLFSFSSGVMLAASILGLILPSVSSDDRLDLILSFAGLITGVVCISFADRLSPHLRHLLIRENLTAYDSDSIDRTLLLIAAITLHNFPEGLAAGVSLGCNSWSQAIFIAGGIALQNIPDGLVVITPMLSIGISPKRTFLFALATGFIEVIGTFIGFFAVSFTAAVLPFALCFAGGIMLFVICDEMIPSAHSGRNGHSTTYSLLAGFFVLLASDVFLS